MLWSLNIRGSRGSRLRVRSPLTCASRRSGQRVAGTEGSPTTLAVGDPGPWAAATCRETKSAGALRA